MAQRDVFPVRLSSVERATIDALAYKLGCSSGDVIRGFIHQARNDLSTGEILMAMEGSPAA